MRASHPISILRTAALMAALTACDEPTRPRAAEEAFVPGCTRDVVRLQVSAGTGWIFRSLEQVATLGLRP